MTTAIRNLVSPALLVALLACLGTFAVPAVAQKASVRPAPAATLQVNGGTDGVNLRWGDMLRLSMQYRGAAPAAVMVLVGEADGSGAIVTQAAFPLMIDSVKGSARWAMSYQIPRTVPFGAYAVQLGSLDVNGTLEVTEPIGIKIVP